MPRRPSISCWRRPWKGSQIDSDHWCSSSRRKGLRSVAALTFADRLHAFLAALPTGANVCVELRDEALLTTRYAEALLATGTAHVFCIHPRMPSLERQREVVGLSAGGAGVIVRWMLHAGLGYEAAKEKYSPFDRLVDPDPTSRAAVGALVVDALATVQDVTVIANNKAEGSAPLTVIELARLLTSIPGVAG